jgi:hypothetical protein
MCFNKLLFAVLRFFGLSDLRRGGALQFFVFMVRCLINSLF